MKRANLTGSLSFLLSEKRARQYGLGCTRARSLTRTVTDGPSRTQVTPSLLSMWQIKGAKYSLNWFEHCVRLSKCIHHAACMLAAWGEVGQVPGKARSAVVLL